MKSVLQLLNEDQREGYPKYIMKNNRWYNRTSTQGFNYGEEYAFITITKFIPAAYQN
jgi:hypothetical protein